MERPCWLGPFAGRRHRSEGRGVRLGELAALPLSGALERLEKNNGTYLAYRLNKRGKATVDVLADIMAGLLRDLTFPKQMRWDAYLEDGKGELLFGRPIRWLILLYGGRVVPFTISRLSASSAVPAVASASARA